MFKSFINEEFHALQVQAQEMDALWANGWRHFGTHFFRYNLSFYENEIRRVFPLRVRLSDFHLSKSQKRILKKNRDLQTIIRPIEMTEEKEILFERHKRRFKSGIPFSIYDFLDYDAAQTPCRAFELCVYAETKLLATSFFDVGEAAISSVYAMFSLDAASRSLGILTMLLEIDYARNRGKNFYYQGYCYEGNSYYDYKKRFGALERFDWNGNWKDFEE